MMVYATRSRILTILLLCFCINVAVAERWAVHLHRRDGPTTSSTDVSTSQSNKPSQTGSSSGDGGISTSGSKVPAITATSNSTSSSTSASATSTVSQITAIPSNLNGASPSSALNLNYTGYNCTANFISDVFMLIEHSYPHPRQASHYSSGHSRFCSRRGNFDDYWSCLHPGRH